MKGVLQSFINESKKDAVSTEPAAASGPSTITTSCLPEVGELMLSGCTDWENMTAKNPTGLEDIHRVDVGAKVSKVFSSSSAMHEFILLENGAVMAMGRNDHGQLGTGDTDTRNLCVPISLPRSVPLVKVAVGRSHTLFLFEDGEVWSCGSNASGQLGIGASKQNTKDILKPVKVPLPADDAICRDIACGHDFSLVCTAQGRLYAYGHPEYGVLGQGNDGQYIKDGGKGAAVQFACEYSPVRIDRFVTKDAQGKVTATRNSSQVRIRAVAAGKNHAVCLEDWEGPDVGGAAPCNRVYSWGWGGYGRLGHNGAQDEFYPREITTFSQSVPSASDPTVKVNVIPTNRQKQIREIVCGSSFALAVSDTRHLYYFGKMSNSPRGEATVYPQLVQELFDYPVRHCAAGSNLIVVVAGMHNRAKGIDGATQGPSYAIAWGLPVGGKLGFEGGSKSSTTPKLLSRLTGLSLSAVSCGYGHVSYVAQNAPLETTGSGSSAAAQDVLSTFPVLKAVPDSGKGSSKKKGREAEASEAKGKKAKR